MISAVVYKRNLNHYGEEVCGDNFQVGRTKNSKIIILSDGLGSGIKASILSILTTEIICTMIEKGIEIEEVVDTIAMTLPVCQTRGIAYSTFTIIQIFKNGKVKIVNYDNPRTLIFKKGEAYQPEYKKMDINGKCIKTCEFLLEKDDFIFAMSDGVLHAGLGNLMNFGWGIENISDYLQKMHRKTRDIKELVDNLIELTESYYGFKPGDDATVLGIKATEKPKAMIFTGPPLDPKTDIYYVNKFLGYEGRKIICGGTTSNIVSRISENEIKIDFSDITTDSIPPAGSMEGVDLVTEGVLTIKALIELVKKCKNNMYELDFKGKLNSAEKLFKLIRECDDIDLLVGRKVNTFYHNPALPFDMSIRSNLIRDFVENLKKLGKRVNVEYC